MSCEKTANLECSKFLEEIIVRFTMCCCPPAVDVEGSLEYVSRINTALSPGSRRLKDGIRLCVTTQSFFSSSSFKSRRRL